MRIPDAQGIALNVLLRAILHVRRRIAPCFSGQWTLVRHRLRGCARRAAAVAALSQLMMRLLNPNTPLEAFKSGSVADLRPLPHRRGFPERTSVVNADADSQHAGKRVGRGDMSELATCSLVLWWGRPIPTCCAAMGSRGGRTGGRQSRSRVENDQWDRIRYPQGARRLLITRSLPNTSQTPRSWRFSVGSLRECSTACTRHAHPDAEKPRIAIPCRAPG